MAATDDRLVGFVGEALERGIPRDEVSAALVGAGWPRDQVKDALRAFADVPFPLPVPAPKPYLSAREAFMYLVLFSTLGVTALNLVSLLFSIIDRLLPDPAALNLGRWGDSVRGSVAALIAAFPVFVYVSSRIARTLRNDPAKRASRVRKWLTYLTLFVAAMTLICDFGALVYNLLGGDMTIRFALKTVTVGAVAGGIFGYYLWDLRGEEREA